MEASLRRSGTLSVKGRFLWLFGGKGWCPLVRFGIGASVALGSGWALSGAVRSVDNAL